MHYPSADKTPSLPIVILLIIGILLLTVWKILSGLDFYDFPFNILLLKEGKPENNLLIPLTIILGNLWGQFISDSYLSYKILAALLFYGKLFLAYRSGIVLFENNKDFKYLFLSGAIIALSFQGLIPGYDAFSDIILVGFIYQFIRTYKYKRGSDYILLGIGIILCTFIRLPNIVVGILALSLPLYEYLKKGLPLKAIILSYSYLIVGVLVSLGIFFALFPVYSAYTNIFSEINKTTQNGSHSLKEIIGYYIQNAGDIFLYLMTCLGMGGILAILKLKLPLKSFLLTGIFLFFLSGFILFLKEADFLKSYSFFLSGFALALLIGEVLFTISKKEYYLIGMVMIVILLPALGSNTGLLKIGGMTLLSIPFLLTQYRKKSIPTGITQGTTQIWEQGLLGLIGVAFVLNIIWSYGDTRKPWKRIYKLDEYPLTGVMTTQDRVTYLNKWIPVLKQEIQGKSVLLLGESANLFRYVLQVDPFLKTNFIQDLSGPNFRKSLKTKLQETNAIDPIIIYFPGSARVSDWPLNLSDNNWKNAEDLNNFSDFLQENGMKENSKEGYVVFEKNLDTTSIPLNEIENHK